MGELTGERRLKAIPELQPGDAWLDEHSMREFRRSHRPLKIATWNVAGLRKLESSGATGGRAFGYQPEPDLAYFADRLTRFDAVCVQEIQQGETDQVALLAAAAGFANVHVTPMCPSHIDAGETLCIATMSRPGLDITGTRDTLLPKAKVPLSLNGKIIDPEGEFDRYAHAVTLAGSLDLINAHLMPAQWLGLSFSSDAGRRYVTAMGECLAAMTIDGPAALLADMNTGHPEQVYHQYFADSRLRSAIPPGASTVPWANTGLVKAAAPDNILVTPHWEDSASGVESTATDHYLVWAELYPRTKALTGTLAKYLMLTANEVMDRYR